MVSIQHSGLDLTCVCVYESEVREYPPPDLITVALHKPLCHKEVKATAIYYPQSISHFLYSGVVKHTPLSVYFFSSQQCVQHRKYNSLSPTDQSSFSGSVQSVSRFLSQFDSSLKERDTVEEMYCMRQCFVISTSNILKGLLHTKMKFTHTHVIANP